MSTERLPQKKRDLMELRQAHGQACVLAVGISEYTESSVFSRLPTCSNDALTVLDTFRDTWQLNADKTRIHAITSRSTPPPSKGVIISSVRRLSESANEDDRIVFFYSGHGHREGDKFYLVPQDAYSEEPDALLDFDVVLSLLERSVAKQKIVFLDACLSGPIVKPSKLAAAEKSKKYLKEYLKTTKGVAILSASGSDQSAFTQSPNPELSLFTYYLLQGLTGNTEALDNSKILTVNGLFDFVSTAVDRRATSYHKDQMPSIDVRATGVPVLGDFGQSIIAPTTFSVDEFPISSLTSHSYESLYVEHVLTDIRNWHYSEGYLERKVNEALGTYQEEEFGKKAADIRRAFGFTLSEVTVEGCDLTFPGGTLSYHYKAAGKKSGKLVAAVKIQKTWFKDPAGIVRLFETLEIRPDQITLRLTKDIKPGDTVNGLESKGWRVDSVLAHKIEASASRARLVVEERKLTFSGLALKEFFGLDGHDEKNELTYGTLALLGG